MTTPITPDSILTDERVADMRANVLRKVNDDLDTRRAGRRRRTLALTGAAAAVVVVVGGGVLIGSQFGGSSDTSSDSSLFNAPTTAAAAPGAPAPARAGAGAGTEALAGAPEAPGVPTGAPTDRQVVTTGTVDLRANDPATAAKALAADVEKAGGRVDERRETGGAKKGGKEKTATLTLRIPSAKVNETVTGLSSLGDVRSVQLRHDDVTTTVVDLDARIRATQLSVDRLTSILAQANTSDKVIEAEGALTKRQQELESLQSRRAKVGEQVSLSTLTVSIEKDGAPDRAGFTGGLQDGWNALAATGRWLLVAGGAALPWLAVLLVLYGGYRVVRRVRSHQ